MNDAIRPRQLAERIVEAILSRRLAPGARLGEQALAELFGASRGVVREALGELAARGMVEANTRRGWFVAQPSEEDTREVFAARQVIEAGVVQSIGKADRTTTRRLREHVAQERAAIAADDIAEGSFLLGDFHVCLAECASAGVLPDVMRDLTARTTLIASLVQTKAEALQSCSEHGAIVTALQRGDTAGAATLLREHLDHVLRRFTLGTAGNAVDSLRNALSTGTSARPPSKGAPAPGNAPAGPARRGRRPTPLLRSVPRVEKG